MEMVRLRYQHQAFYCYVILSIWIFLIIAGMYKYIIQEKRSHPKRILTNEYPSRVGYSTFLQSVGIANKVFKFCNIPSNITLGSEGQIDEENVKLAGVLVFIRHGDRGPLTHIRNVSVVNCASDTYSDSELQNTYQNYINLVENASLYFRTAWSRFLGPFHGFPMLPTKASDCKLAQLTTQGVKQLLKTGLLLRSAYYNKLNISGVDGSTENVVVYSTRYRRTVQSAVALLYGFFETDAFQNLAKIALRESHSYAFCNMDCGCLLADNLFQQQIKELDVRLKSHPAIVDLINRASNIVFERELQVQFTKPYRLRDALLTYICHNAPLPCIEHDSRQICIKPDQVTGLFAYTDWEAKQYERSSNHRKHGLLRAYGMLRNVVSRMLQIISEARPKFILFSGHSKTIEYLAIALGISQKLAIPEFASRIVVEVHKVNRSNAYHVANDFYFRILVNGKDFTHKIPFCKSANSYAVKFSSVDSKQVKKVSMMCPIESIVRQLHDDYFAPFNVTNFKDACSSIPKWKAEPANAG